MDSMREVDVSVAGLKAMRASTDALHTGIKEVHGVGRIEHGETEWWGGGRTWRSTRGCVLLKQPGDVVRHLSHRGATTYSVVQLPAEEVARVRDDGRPMVLAQLEPGDPRAAPFHRLLDAVASRASSFTLEVALTEAISALAEVTAGDYARPVRRALDYLRARYAESVTLSDLAAHAGLDKFHLCRAFRAQVGLPPHAYLTHLRIARAKALLEKGVRASELAPQVGLYDQAQLTRHFRRLVGTTPARYARSVRASSP